MAVGTTVVEFGTVREVADLEVPRDFSNAVSLVITLSARSTEPERERGGLNWRLQDAVDGSHWWAVEDTLGDFVGYVKGRRNRDYQTRRFVVPFGPLLRLGVWPEDHKVYDNGIFESVVATMYWRELG